MDICSLLSLKANSCHDIFLPVIKATKFANFFTLNGNIKEGLKTFLLFFCQTKMVFVTVWFLNHFTLEFVPSMNSIWIITSASLLHAWVTKFKTFFIFFKLPILTSNSIIWVNFFTVLFDEAQHVVKVSTTGYVLVFYEVIISFLNLKIFC